MEITGTQQILAPRNAVWDALNDPAILKQCLPGCELVERTSPEEFRTVVAAAIGPLRARFNGKLRMTEAKPPESCVMVFEGQGGAVGFGKGSSSVSLRETPDGTELSYSANAQVGGKLAQVGSRLIDSVARKMSDDFFKAFRLQLAPTTASSNDATASPKAGAIADPDQAASSGPRPISAAATPAASGSAIPGTAMVPGWWLAVAFVLGSAATIAGVLLVR